MDKKKQMLIPLSFKEEERWIYEECMKHSSKAGWIKDVLVKEIQREKTTSNNDNSTTSINAIDDLIKF